ncbi:unnamed protein product [Lampetra fluviatilis]
MDRLAELSTDGPGKREGSFQRWRASRDEPAGARSLVLLSWPRPPLMAFVKTRWALIFLLLYLSWREASSQPCGGVLTERRGEVASPGYPQPGYPNRVRCTWEIRAGGRDTVRIRMRSMRIEDDPTCRWDFLEVRFTGREPTRLCGSDMSRVPNGGVMQGRGETVIYLQSDDSVNDAGFLLNYEGTLTPCGMFIPPPCDSQPCQRGARCVEISQDDFRCNCPRGYTGKGKVREIVPEAPVTQSLHHP